MKCSTDMFCINVYGIQQLPLDFSIRDCCMVSVCRFCSSLVWFVVVFLFVFSFFPPSVLNIVNVVCGNHICNTLQPRWVEI